MTISHLSGMRLGFDGYARMLAATIEPRTAQQIAEHVGCSLHTVWPAMAYCARAGIVGAVGWHRPAPKSRMVPTWRLGADQTPDPDQRRESRAKPRGPLLLLVALLQAAREEPMTVRELAKDLRYSVCVLQMRVRALHEAGLLHIAAWDRPLLKGTSVARYAFGPGVDRPRPKRLGKAHKAAYQRAYHQRRKTAELLGLRAA
jgi:hypothetical protein